MLLATGRSAGRAAAPLAVTAAGLSCGAGAGGGPTALMLAWSLGTAGAAFSSAPAPCCTGGPWAWAERGGMPSGWPAPALLAPVDSGELRLLVPSDSTEAVLSGRASTAGASGRLLRPTPTSSSPATAPLDAALLSFTEGAASSPRLLSPEAGALAAAASPPSCWPGAATDCCSPPPWSCSWPWVCSRGTLRALVTRSALLLKPNRLMPTPAAEVCSVPVAPWAEAAWGLEGSSGPTSWVRVRVLSGWPEQHNHQHSTGPFRGAASAHSHNIRAPKLHACGQSWKHAQKTAAAALAGSLGGCIDRG